MGFIDSYKHLEKICGEVLGDDRRVSAYIDEMLRLRNGSYYVRTWNEDLKNLKHYRWVRNQISHEPNCTEENMCEPEDEKWLEEFYFRIMNQTDPLSLYYQATRARKAIKPTPIHSESTFIDVEPIEEEPPKTKIGCIPFLLIAFLIVAVMLVIFSNIK